MIPHLQLHRLTGGSATGLSATGAWHRAAADDLDSVRLLLETSETFFAIGKTCRLSRDSAGASRGWLSFRSNCELPHIGAPAAGMTESSTSNTMPVPSG